MLAERTITTRVTLAILSVLLITRILYTAPVLTDNNVLWLQGVYYSLTYILLTVVIYINRSSLSALNVDNISMKLFIFLGYIYPLIAFHPIGILVFLVAIFNSNFLFPRSLVSRTRYGVYTFLSSGASVATALIYFWWLGKPWPMISGTDILNTAIKANFTLVFYEELVFRGILWMFLEKIGLKKYQVIAAQAFFFWIIHFYYLFLSPVFFWIITPVFSILFGVIVYKSKSLFPGFVSHYLYNFLSILLSIH